MTCRTEVLNNLSYRYCPDNLPILADRIQAIMMGRFVDELTGNPVRARIQIKTGLPLIGIRTSADAVGGLIVNPTQRFPGLAASPVTLDMRVSCRRFLSQSFETELGPFNTGLGHPDDFPRYFEASNLGDIELHREASMIQGRCVRNGGVSRTSLVNASVSIVGIWHRFPAADVDPIGVMQPANIVSLQQGLYRARAVGTDQLRQRTLLPLAGDEKRLLQPAQAGTSELSLSDRINLNVGDILGVEIGHAEKVEYIEVTAIDGTSSANQPATVTLAYSLRQDHRLQVEAVPMNPQPGGTVNQFIRDAIAGDQTLFLDALTNIDNTVLEISGAGDNEYHAVSLYNVTSDDDGFYRLPPISRVAMMQITANHAVAVGNVDITFSPDYEQFGNTLDLVFS